MKDKIDKVLDALGVVFAAIVTVVSIYAVIALVLYFLECVGVC